MKAVRYSLPLLAFALSIAGLNTAQAYVSPQGPPPPPPGYAGPGRWDAPPPEYREFQRQGFMDGMDGARKDYGNHRRPNVNNRDEYRHPNVPRQFRGEYREAFRHGYERAMMHLLNGGPGPR